MRSDRLAAAVLSDAIVCLAASIFCRLNCPHDQAIVRGSGTLGKPSVRVKMQPPQPWPGPARGGPRGTWQIPSPGPGMGSEAAVSQRAALPSAPDLSVDRIVPTVLNQPKISGRPWGAKTQRSPQELAGQSRS